MYRSPGSPRAHSAVRGCLQETRLPRNHRRDPRYCRRQGTPPRCASHAPEKSVDPRSRGPEKPGNIGALLRTADAADADAVIIANPKTDLYNPNIIRSSVGCLFTRNIATGTTAEVIAFLRKHDVGIYGAALTASVPYHTCDYTGSTALVVGTEATGLSAAWLDNSDQNIIIPMQGEIDSMNVSVSAAILIFEAKRQRQFL